MLILAIYKISVDKLKQYLLWVSNSTCELTTVTMPSKVFHLLKDYFEQESKPMPIGFHLLQFSAILNSQTLATPAIVRKAHICTANLSDNNLQFSCDNPVYSFKQL